MTSETKRASLPASPLSDEPRQKRETPRLQPLATNRNRSSQPLETAMTSELRPAVEMVNILADHFAWCSENPREKAAAIIRADREAVRAEQAAELAKFKALAETLAGALARCGRIVERHNWRQSEKVDDLKQIAAEALRQYKEARDA